jgi:GT2 family glycosyltransferase
MPIVLESLESIANLDYPLGKYELIVVDNGSTDSSFEKIRGFLEKKCGLRKKIIRLGKNLGFTGGNNVGFKARDPESRYVVLVNNDCIISNDSVKLYVETLENFSDLGAAQGVILKLDVRDIDSTGIYLSDLLITLGFPKNSKEALGGKVFLCSAVEGTFSIFRVNALLKAFNTEKIFSEVLYGFGEDVFTSIQLWRAGYRTAFIAKAVAKHRRGATWSSPTAIFLSTRNYQAMAHVFLAGHKQILRTLLTLRIALSSMFHEDSRVQGKYMLRGLIESRKLSGKLIQKHYELKPPCTMPLIHIPLRRAIVGMAKRKTLVEYAERAIIKNLDSWTIGRV